MKIHRITLLASGLITLLTLGSGNAIVSAQDTPATANTGSANLYLPLIADGNGNRADVVAQDVVGQDVAAQEEQLAAATALNPTVPITKTDFATTALITALSSRAELFVSCVDNPYFPLIPGTVYHYTEPTPDGVETIAVTVTNQIKEIKGIQATEIRDTVLLNGEVKEDTFDWYAQDDRGNVWYLGEDTKEYENGQVSSTAGSWLTGVKGAVPGIIMLGAPRPGDLYRQEFLRGEAEDMGAVMSLAEPAYSPFAFLSKALMTADFNVLGNLLEYKFYLRHVGHVRTLKVEDGAVSKLNSVSHARSQIVLDRGCGKSGGTPFVGTIRLRNGEKNLRQFAKVTSAQAEAAVRAVVANADITKTELEAENGFLVYTVTLNNEQEAIVDAGDGFVLALTPVEDVE